MIAGTIEPVCSGTIIQRNKNLPLIQSCRVNSTSWCLPTVWHLHETKTPDSTDLYSWPKLENSQTPIVSLHDNVLSHDTSPMRQISHSLSWIGWQCSCIGLQVPAHRRHLSSDDDDTQSTYSCGSAPGSMPCSPTHSSLAPPTQSSLSAKKVEL